MKTYKVGICDQDLEYATALMDYINHAKTQISVVAFSRMSAVKDYLSINDLDLIVTDNTEGCIVSEDKCIFCDIKTVKLAEFSVVSEGWQEIDNQETYIYKYQPASQILKLILGEMVIKKSSGRKVAEVFAVYSPLGRCGKTRLAKAIAANDEVRGGLYIGMEDFSSNIDSMTTDILYLLKTSSSDLEEAVLKAITSENDIHILGISGTYLDTHDVSFSEMKKLLEMLLKTGRFTTIVCDIGSAAITDMKIFECFDRIYLPTLRDKVSKDKIEIFKKLMKDTGNRAVLSRFVEAELPDAEPDDNEYMKGVWRLMKDNDE